MAGNWVRFPRPGRESGAVMLRYALITSYAPSTEQPDMTDIWCGRKLTVAQPFHVVDKILQDYDLELGDD